MRTYTTSIFIRLTAISILFFACSPEFKQTDCVNLQAGDNYKTGRAHCCENALWKLDLKNATLGGTTQSTGGEIKGHVGGIVTLDIKGKQYTSNLSSLREVSNILATHFPKSHCRDHDNTCEEPYIKDRLNAVGQIVFTNITDEEAGVSFQDLLKSIGVDANFSNTTKTVTTTTGSFCFFQSAKHMPCGSLGIEAPPGGIGYYYDSSLLTRLTPGERDSLKRFALERGIKIGKKPDQ